MNTYKHSGTLGDIIYALPIMKHLGGGEFYLHMNQIDWIGQHYYGSKPNPFHQGRMTQQDANFMQSFFEAQTYITKFAPLDTNKDAITHNLDRFRPAFVGHPGNYVDIYANTFGINNPTIQSTLRNTPWLTVPNVIESRSIVINRTARWTPRTLSSRWENWQEMGWEKQSVFVGLPEEHEAFTRATGWDIPFRPTDTLLELAQVIAGASQFIGNQSVALSVAIGLGVNWACEARDDLPLERNECYFKDHPNGEYF
jgi:ADP-heptose:LPS heptosyltransferase